MLASIGASTVFSFEQEKIGDKVWLPSSMEANISAIDGFALIRP